MANNLDPSGQASIQYVQDDIQLGEIHELLSFINELLFKLVELTPNEFKEHIHNSINRMIFDFTSRNAEFMEISKDNLSIILKENSQIQTDQLILLLNHSFESLQVNIDSNEDLTWGKALIQDAIESLMIKGITRDTSVDLFLQSLNFDTEKYLRIVKNVIPKLEDKEKSVFVTFLTLFDLGPELVIKVSNDDEISKGLDDNVASQILTLVGQGSSYHEGIFGPIPVPTANNICALIWSKIINSNIKDERMNGKSLSVIAIGFHSELLTHLPSQSTVKELFSVLDHIEHVDNVTEELLLDIQTKFLKLLK